MADTAPAEFLELAAVVRAYQWSRALTVAAAPPVLSEAGVADRVEVVPGDCFTEVPDGADAYLLSRILHDWPDQEAGTILRQVRTAMAPGSVLLLHEAVLGAAGTEPAAAFLDLMMLVSPGGRERTENEWRALLSEAGLRWVGAVPVGPSSSLVTAVPR